ncbi:CRISPR-associated helicase/endonuclease Cas3 [Pusillimonas noertemannii]|uniref:CRISPR-associated helicase/endonuclease Cas3 n=1 Tax=Pusillimonas noertemannii TaxID=305977 RepID=UPI001AD8CF73|nr:hypothetical protein [Pusillimonas noertemannii]
MVILDEAQLLPPEFLQPILDVLNLLTKHYGVTVVISTATQPALASREYFDARQSLRGLGNVREIIADPDALYEALERVKVRLPTDWQQSIEWPQLAEELSAHDSVLAIVNTRKDARALWEAMPHGTLHLSALMCGAHRSQVIQDIKVRLKAGIPTRVVSTQLVEAGVDVDFPNVYRALAGLDSLAQAAGRCNREGKLEGWLGAAGSEADMCSAICSSVRAGASWARALPPRWPSASTNTDRARSLMDWISMRGLWYVVAKRS